MLRVARRWIHGAQRASLGGLLAAVCCTPSTPPQPSSAPASGELAPGADGNRRLTRAVVPQRYRLHFDLDPGADTFQGVTDIEVHVAQATRLVHLHSQGLELLEVTVERGADSISPRVDQGPEGGLLLELPEPVQGALTLHFEYRAGLEEVPDSLYRAREGDEWYAFTQFEAMAAREAFPCFDEPQFKTPYAVSVTAPEGLTVAANAPLVRSTDEGGRTRHEFDVTPPLPTYLVALAVGKFDVVTAGVASPDASAASAAPPPAVPLRILTPAGKGRHAAYALRQTGPILETLVDYFGRPYPYAKLDMVAVPSFRAGAMENAGLITYRERLLVMDESVVSARDKLASRSVIAHELSHMWFGDLVTMRWWDDLWLNEAFATWMAGKVIDVVAPETESELRAVQSKTWVMGVDALESATPIKKEIRHSGDVRNAFDPITYRKGQSVLRMLESWVGERAFQRGIRRYLKAHEWGNATASDLLDALDEATGKDVTRVAESFIETAGAPLVSVDWSCEAGSATLSLSQRRYRLASSDASSDASSNASSNAQQDGGAPGERAWAIPICLTLAEGDRRAEECLLFDERSTSLRSSAPFCPDFVHPNRDEAGYFRWSLPSARMRELAGRYLMRLAPVERVALASHAQALLEAGELDGAVYLDLVTGLARDPHWLTLKSVLASIAVVDDLVTDAGARRHLAAWAHATLAPHVARIGASPRADEPEGHRLVRAELIETFADVGKDAATLRAARKAAQRFVEDPESLPADQARLYLSLVARSGDAALHAQLVQLVTTTRSPSVRGTALAGLSHFESPPLLRKSLELLLDGTLRAQDYWAIVATPSNEERTRGIVWRWMVESEQRLIELLGTRMAEQLPWLVAGACSEEAREAGRAHFEADERLGPGARQNLEQALETSSRCIAMRRRHAASVTARLTTLAGS